MQLERLRDYGFRELGLDEASLDGPVLLPWGTFGLLASLRGKNGGSMASPAELRWPRDVPARLRSEAVHVFVRIGKVARYLGMAHASRRGQPARDGFKIAFALDEALDDASFRALVEAANAPLAAAPEEAIAALDRRSTTAERTNAMRVFVERWFGLAVGPAPAALDVVPSPLGELYAAAGSQLLCSQNHLIDPTRLSVDDERLPFYVENQGVRSWAIDLGAGTEDPPVLVREESSSAPWKPEAETLSAFLVQLLVMEAAFGAPFGASEGALEGRAFAKLTRRVVPLPLPSWSSSRIRFFGAGGVIGFACPNGNGYDVWIGAKERERLEPIEDLVTDWADVRF